MTPSVWPEPLGVAVGEAMLAGLPTVASNVGGIDTWIEHQHDGILVPPGDPQALASALGTLIDDGELRDRLGQTARATVARRFTMRRHLEALAAIQSAIAAEREAVSAYR